MFPYACFVSSEEVHKTLHVAHELLFMCPSILISVFLASLGLWRGKARCGMHASFTETKSQEKKKKNVN